MNFNSTLNEELRNLNDKEKQFLEYIIDLMESKTVSRDRMKGEILSKADEIIGG